MTKPDTITGDQRSVLAKLAPLLQDGSMGGDPARLRGLDP
jgi:hypothetical protein